MHHILIISATQEADIGKIIVWDQSRQNVAQLHLNQ
jgi:hypothetical protein